MIEAGTAATGGGRYILQQAANGWRLAPHSHACPLRV